MAHTAIFDIGKTNKKLFVFDEDYQQLYRDYQNFPEIVDEDEHPTDDLAAIQKWLKSSFNAILNSKNYNIKAINFSTYGASFVYVDHEGKVVAPLYNYTKPYPDELLAKFIEKHGDLEQLALTSASPNSGMLNAGLQLFRLKYEQPAVFAKVKYALHFPQYLSYVFTGIAVSDYTSIGCHTSLWDYAKEDYHNWVYDEELHKILPPVVPTNTSINFTYNDQRMRIGVGIHDSSAALLPYFWADEKPFLLISTGTWSITLNPFNDNLLTEAELNQDSLNYMRIDGQPVRAARLFLGNEYKQQVTQLCEHYGVTYGAHRTIEFDRSLWEELSKDKRLKFHFNIGNRPQQPAISDLSNLPDFRTAFHQLMIELVDLQIVSIDLAKGNTPIRRMYIDGGFADNQIFVALLAHHYRNCKVRTTQSPLGSALGACMIISDKKVKSSFLKKKYQLRKHRPFIMEE